MDYGSVVDALYPAQERVAREINPKVFAAREWRAKLEERDPFVLNSDNGFVMSIEFSLQLAEFHDELAVGG